VALQRKTKRSADEYADDLKQIVLKHFPDAQFELHRARAKEYDLVVINKSLDDLFDVLPISSKRVEDILVESGIHIHVIPLGRGLNTDS
jgi:hypothetical protein